VALLVDREVAVPAARCDDNRRARGCEPHSHSNIHACHVRRSTESVLIHGDFLCGFVPAERNDAERNDEDIDLQPRRTELGGRQVGGQRRLMDSAHPLVHHLRGRLGSRPIFSAPSR
jgi:hypothetical protein